MCAESMTAVCKRLDLFDVGDDLSDETIAKLRNNYFQKEMSKKIHSLSEDTTYWITLALNVHLNLGQSLVMNTSEVFMSLETLSMESLSSKLVKQIENAQIHLPFKLTSNISNDSTISLRVRFFLDHVSPLIVSFPSVVYGATLGLS